VIWNAKRPRLKWVDGSSEPLLLLDEQLFDPEGPSVPQPNQTYSVPIYHSTGISDHLSVGAVLQR
jgi:hypothetical protein